MRVGMETTRLKYEEMMKNKINADLQMTDWLTEIKVALSTEFQELTARNTELVTTNEILLQQVTALKSVQEQLRNMVDEDEEIDVQGVFVSNADIEVMKAELKQTGNLIWKGIKERINTILMRP